MHSKLAHHKRAAQLVYVLTQEGQRPAAVITDQKIADEWANSSTERDYFAYNVDDYVPTESGQFLNTFESGRPGDSNHGKEPPTDLRDIQL